MSTASISTMYIVISFSLNFYGLLHVTILGICYMQSKQVHLLYKAYLQHKDEIINQIIEYMENYDDYLPVIRKQVNTLNKEFFSGDELYRAISDG